MTGNASSGGPSAPRGGVPHPSDTPLDPYSPRDLNQEPHTSHLRALKMVAQNIRSTEATLSSLLSQLGKPQPQDLRTVTVNPQQEIMLRPHNYPTARRVSTAQSNLESYYRRWAQLCDQHLAEVEALNDDTDDSGESS